MWSTAVVGWLDPQPCHAFAKQAHPLPRCSLCRRSTLARHQRSGPQLRAPPQPARLVLPLSSRRSRGGWSTSGRCRPPSPPSPGQWRCTTWWRGEWESHGCHRWLSRQSTPALQLSGGPALLSCPPLTFPHPPPAPHTTPCSCSALFWQPTSIALGLFTMPDGQVPLVHFSCTPLDLILNAPNYTGGAAGGCLAAGCGQNGICCCVPPVMMDWGDVSACI